MSEIKVYVSCYKADFYLLKSCIASIRYWNREVPVYLLKDLSAGNFGTTMLEQAFDIKVVKTRYKKLGGYVKLQPYIEHMDELVFLQDADMVWNGDIIELLKNHEGNIVVDAYFPTNVDVELNRWFFNTRRLKQFYPNYVYPGFVFNAGCILINTTCFSETDFKEIIMWQERAAPIHDDVFLCEDQGIINYIVAEKYLHKSISLIMAPLQISSESKEAKLYDVGEIKKHIPANIIVHWFGAKTGLNSFCSSGHLLRFYEKQYYSHFKNGYFKLITARLARTIGHFDNFIYEMLKSVYYFLTGRK